MASTESCAKSFTATLERSGPPLQWVIVRLPFNAPKLWGRRGQIRVRGEINGSGFRTSLFPDGGGGHYLLVNKKMQAGGRAAPGMKARFRLEPDREERVATEPEELMRILRQEKQLLRLYQDLNYSIRRWLAGQVSEGKQAATRKRRAEQIAELFLETLEAERELPPLIRAALERNAKARRGWERMTRAQRRAELMGVFYYRQPQSRARRLEKAVERMEERAEKRNLRIDD